MNLLGGISNRGLIRVAEMATWCAPPLVIPTLRYFQDPPESRRRLFVRDFSTYSLGAMVYFGAKLLALQLFRPLIRDTMRRQLAALLVGLSANMIFAGLAAVRLSRLADRHLPRLIAIANARLHGLPVDPAFRLPARAMDATLGGLPGLERRSGAFDVFQRA